ncbi:MAG: right-handed parallel beta-helix repeat-containing protein [Bacteroidota bacterium]
MVKKTLVILMVIILNIFTARGSTIEVGGILTGNTTWTNDNTYIVTDNIIVYHNITLHIEEGTTVRFNQGRGINIEGGKLHITGTATDSVFLLPNHAGDESWNWNGIVISSVVNPGDIVIEHALLQQAIYGIRIISGRNIIIRNSHLHGNFFMGISMINSSNCTIESNRITDNFLGLEIFAADPGNQSANNIVRGNFFSNHTTNINIQNNNHGACPNNVVEDNIIRDGLHGIWLFNSSQGGSGHAHIRRNIIMYNGSTSDGFGLYAAMDSSVISNNIFWRNTTAAAIAGSVADVFDNNIVYENREGLSIRNNTQNISITNNTFAANTTWAVSIVEGLEVALHQNNILNNLTDSALVQNLTPLDFNIPYNYWNTLNDSLIMRMLYDGNDNAEYGIFNHQPILDEANTMAPVSPPANPVAQYINSFTRISWRPNPEKDLAGYKVYFGDFEDYSFSQSSEITSDTEYIVQGHSTLQFAVTAADTVASNGNPQLSGNESAFAFVTFVPWAGNDTVVCVSQSFVSLEKSTLPPATDSLLWITAGDGTFSQPHQLQTDYVPGPADKENGEVVITLIAFTGEIARTDSLVLTLAPLPFADAGQNTIIATGESYSTQNASAMYYDQLQWTSSGDGIFVIPGNLNTLYIPGLADVENGEVTLYLEASSSYCEPVRDSVKISIRENFSVQGRVWGENQPQPNNPVVAVLFKETEVSGYSSLTFTDEQGQFFFPALFEGTYLFYAPTDTLGNSNFIATYHPAHINWQEAFVHDLNGDIRELDIMLVEKDYQLPEGNGHISGHFTLPDQTYSDLIPWCSQWFQGETHDNCLQGLSNVTMLLYSLSMRKIYGYTLTDHTGSFSFRNLPYGNYVVKAELPGFDTAISEVLYIHPGQQQLGGITIFISDPLKISIEVPTQPQVAMADSWQVFPNPARDYVYLQYGGWETDAPLEITILDPKGKKYLHSNTAAANLVRINLERYPKGFLVVIARQGEKTILSKIIRR